MSEKSSSYFQGLKISHKGTGLYQVDISPGFYVPDKSDIYWKDNYTYLNGKTATIEIIRNKNSVPRMDYIVAKADYSLVNGIYCGIRIYCKEGKLRDTVTEFPDNLDKDEFLLGFLYNPGTSEGNNISLSLISLNNSDISTSFTIPPSDLRKEIIYSLRKWYRGTFYIKEEIVNYNNILYYCKMTHASQPSFAEDLKYYWDPIGGSGGSAYSAPPEHSVQFNFEGNKFGGSANFLWYNAIKELYLNGSIRTKATTQSISTPDQGDVVYTIKDDGKYIVSLLKMSNGIEYVISSLEK